MHNFKKVFTAIVSVIVVVLVLKGLDLALYPCTFMRNDVHAIVTEPFDELIVGTSHGKMNIDPDVMKSVTGNTGHNLCVGGEFAMDAYYLVKLAVEKQSPPRRILYDISPGYFSQKKEEGNNYLLFYHEFPLSKAKAEYYKAAINPVDFRSTLFPWYEYPLQYEVPRIKDTLSMKLSGDYSVGHLKSEIQEYHTDGYIERYPVDTSTLPASEVEPFSEESIVPENFEYLKKLIDFCKENDIEFVAVTTPIPIYTLKTNEDLFRFAWGYFDSFFQEQEVPYLNFNAQYFQVFSHDIRDFVDYDGHMNGDAARRFSLLLANILEQNRITE